MRALLHKDLQMNGASPQLIHKISAACPQKNPLPFEPTKVLLYKLSQTNNEHE
jgi:hypothetical protein